MEKFNQQLISPTEEQRLQCIVHCEFWGLGGWHSVGFLIKGVS